MELEHSLLEVVEVPAKEVEQEPKLDEGDGHSLTPLSTSFSCNHFALAKPSTPIHLPEVANEDLHRPLTSLNCAQGPYVLGDGVCHTTFSLLPLLRELPRQSRKSLLNDVIDLSPTRNLERAGRINWHAGCAMLVALRTESDGNCLAHAAALGCWGVHDRKLLLRSAIRSFLINDPASKEGRVHPVMARGTGGKRLVRLIRKSWEEELGKYGVQLEKGALDSEWAVLAKQAENSTMENGLTSAGGLCQGRDLKDHDSFAYLEAAHIYVLAHVLRRPIIVLATDWVDAKGRQLALAEEIAGVYLPLELPRQNCSRMPLVLAYDNFHFSPLLPVDPSLPSYLPLVTSSARPDELLPMPFYVPGERNKHLRAAVLKHYLACTVLADGVLAASIQHPEAPKEPRMSPFSAASFPADGLLSLLLSNIIEEEEFQLGKMRERGGAFPRKISAAVQSRRRSDSSPPRPLSLSSLPVLSARENSGKQQHQEAGQGLPQGRKDLRGQQREQRHLQNKAQERKGQNQATTRQEKQQHQRKQNQEICKSSSCSSLGRRATSLGDSSVPVKIYGNGDQDSCNDGLVKDQPTFTQQLYENKELVMALKLYWQSKQEDRQSRRQVRSSSSTMTSTAPSPPKTVSTPPAVQPVDATAIRLPLPSG